MGINTHVTNKKHLRCRCPVHNVADPKKKKKKKKGIYAYK